MTARHAMLPKSEKKKMKHPDEQKGPHPEKRRRRKKEKQ
jgi:hypothetical protein